MTISLIVAMDENRVIGHKGRLPWHLAADMKYFKTVTMGKPLIMGRHTHESIGKPLPGRTNIVITKDAAYQAPGCLVVHAVEEALTTVIDHPEVMVMGGATLYEQLLPRASRIYVTEVHAQVAGDTYFPTFNLDEWREVSRSDHVADDNNSHAYSFVVLKRASGC